MAKTAAQKAQQNREYSRSWYTENKEEYNAKRRERYKANKEQREKARERAARYRAEQPDIERELFRTYKGKKMRVFSTGQVAAEMNRTPQMLRNWEKEGLIPEAIFPDHHRLYTVKQKSMILQLAETIAANNGSWTAPKVKKAVSWMHKRWQ
jgi:hypothetical protein